MISQVHLSAAGPRSGGRPLPGRTLVPDGGAQLLVGNPLHLVIFRYAAFGGRYARARSRGAGVRGSGIGTLIFGKVGYLAACLAAAIVLVVSGYAHGLVGATTAVEGGANLGSSVPPTGAMNILLMGLESRTDFQGHFLSAAQLTQTHSGKESTVQAGSAGAGSQDTDTLILIHVFAGGQTATGYSIPRDDVVNFPHEVNPGTGEETEGKIDAAYLYAYDQFVSQNNGKMSSDSLYAGANRAGQLFETE